MLSIDIAPDRLQQLSLLGLLAGLLPNDVLGVPVRPVRIRLPGPLLVLGVRCLRTSERGRKLSRRGECHLTNVDLLRFGLLAPEIVAGTGFTRKASPGREKPRRHMGHRGVFTARALLRPTGH